MRALVTGSNGFIGSFLVERLLDKDWKVRCLVRKTSNLRWLEGLDIELAYGEMFDISSLHGAVKNADVVFHLAGVTKGKSEQDYIRGNYQATINMLKACQDSGGASKKFILISSQAAGGPSRENSPLSEEEATSPISAYGRSKKMAEQAVLEYSQQHPATIIRPPSVYGPRDIDFLQLFKIVNRGVIPKPGGGNQKISIIHVQDLVDGILQTAEKEIANGEIFFLSHDQPATFDELGRIVADALGTKAITLPIPLWAIQGASLISSGFSKISGRPALLNKDKVLEMKQPAWLCSAAKAQKLLGFQAKIDLIEGMKQTAEWYKNIGWL